MLTGNPQPETIHDFGGFPDGALSRFAIRRPARRSSRRDAVALLKDAGITAGVDGCRGLDHGAWVPLRWMYPGRRRAGRAALGAAGARHRASRASSGRALAPLARRRRADRRLGPHDAQPARLDGQPRGAASRCATRRSSPTGCDERLAAHDTDALVAYRERAPDAARAHPTEEHFLPLLVAGAPPGTIRGSSGSSTASRPARCRSIRTCSIRRIEAVTGAPVGPSSSCTTRPRRASRRRSTGDCRVASYHLVDGVMRIHHTERAGRARRRAAIAARARRAGARSRYAAANDSLQRSTPWCVRTSARIMKRASGDRRRCFPPALAARDPRRASSERVRWRRAAAPSMIALGRRDRSGSASRVEAEPEDAAMPHLLDPQRLDSEAAYLDRARTTSGGTSMASRRPDTPSRGLVALRRAGRHLIDELRCRTTRLRGSRADRCVAAERRGRQRASCVCVRVEHRLGRGEILEREADRLEHRDLRRRACARGARRARDRRDRRRCLPRAIAPLAIACTMSPPSASAAVRSSTTMRSARAHRGIVGLAHAGLERADEVEMHARRAATRRGRAAPSTASRTTRCRPRAPRASRSRTAVTGKPSRAIARAAASRVLRRATPQAHALDRPDVRVRFDQPARDAARSRPARDAARRARARRSRRVRRCARGAARGDLLAVEQRERRAVARVEQRVDGADRALAALARCPGNTVTSFTPIRRPVRHAGISSSDAVGSPGTSIG